jgi:hypothetical protein
MELHLGILNFVPMRNISLEFSRSRIAEIDIATCLMYCQYSGRVQQGVKEELYPLV